MGAGKTKKPATFGKRSSENAATAIAQTHPTRTLSGAGLSVEEAGLLARPGLGAKWEVTADGRKGEGEGVGGQAPRLPSQEDWPTKLFIFGRIGGLGQRASADESRWPPKELGDARGP